MALTPDNLFYETTGKENGPSVLLSSGLGGSASFWAPQIPELAKLYHVVTYDHRGTGRSTRTLRDSQSVDTPYSVDDMAEDMRLVLDAARTPSVHIVGHAAGALAAFAFALKQPGRVASITAVNAWSKLDPHTARCFETRLTLLRTSGRRAYVRAQPIFLYPATWISENTERLEAEERHMIRSFPRGGVMQTRIAALEAFDIDDRLSAITMPVLLSATADDMLVPVTCSRRLAEGLPNATLDIMPWGGHAMSVTDPERFNAALLGFLAGVSGQK